MLGQKLNLRYKLKTAKETLGVIENTWLEKHEVETARHMSNEDYSEDECEQYLKYLETCCANRLFRWQHQN